MARAIESCQHPGFDSTKLTLVVDWGINTCQMVHVGLLFENVDGFETGTSKFKYTLMHKKYDEVIMVATNNKDDILTDNTPLAELSVMCFNMGPLVCLDMGHSMEPMTVLVDKINELQQMSFAIDPAQPWYCPPGKTNCGHFASNMVKALTGTNLTWDSVMAMAATGVPQRLALAGAISGTVETLRTCEERARVERSSRACEERARVQRFESVARNTWTQC